MGCFPAARVHVDGADLGTTPLRVELPPGEHEVVLRLEGFDESRRRLTVEPGATQTIEAIIVASGSEDPRVLARLGGEMQVAIASVAPLRRLRGDPEGPPVQVLFPRGLVRTEDLTTYRVDLADVGYVPVGTIEFRRGEEVLHREPYAPRNVVLEAEIPEEVRAALRPGDAVTWGYFPARGSPTTGEFRVAGATVERETAERLAEVERRLAGQPDALIRHLRCQILLARGLDRAAFDEARRIVAEREDSARAWAVALEALRRMGLAETSIATDVQSRLDRFDDATREALLAPGSDAGRNPDER